MTRKEIRKKTIDFDDAIHRIVRLEEENAKLKSECRRCVYTDCPCVLSDFGKDRNGICDHFKDIFDENVELKEKVSYLEDNLRVAREDRKNLQLEVGKGLYANRYYAEQLAKAKEIISETKESINTIIETAQEIMKRCDD